MSANFSERTLTVKDVAIHSCVDTAWAEVDWDFVAKLRKGGSPLATHDRATQLYRGIDGQWSLIHVHYSGMPVTGERRGY